MKAEKAVSMSAPEFRAARASALKGGGLLYLGDEFCQNLLPDRDDFGAAAEKFGRVVLVTPLLADAAFDEAERIIDRFSSAPEKLEVVVNDLGLLHTVKRRYAKRVDVALGRVFAHRVKVMPAGFARRFLKEHGVKRVEIDDPALLPRFEAFGVKFSFHTPFRYLSATRFCPWERHWPGPCSLSCLGKTRKLEHPRLPRPLILKGQAYGLRTAGLPAHPALDRVVTGTLRGAGRG
ncbi:MAG: hypothetical protein HY550_02030 [Elusimicrobia bacterium]|nr:hypothetical protein [Elusimicrobiota bacterium]